MKKRILSMVIAIVMVIGLVPSFAIAASAVDGTTWDGTTVATSYESGTGTEADPYIIKTAGQLIYFRNQVNVGVKYNGQYFLLDADLDMDSKTFGDPIGKVSAYFNGHFDGGNHKISNLKIGNSNGYSALFGNVGYNGEQSVIKNLTLVNVAINRTHTNYGAAAIVGNPRYVKLENCTVESGTIQCSGYATGGLIATVNTNETFGLTVINCVNKAAVTSTSGDSNGTGGIVGKGCDNAQIIGCVNYGDVTGKRAVAGIIGNAGATTVEKCANFGDIASSGHIGTKPSKAAGILATDGDVVIKIENCYNAGDIYSDGTTPSGVVHAGGAGGIAVFSKSSNVQKTVANCYSVGNVTGNYSYPIALRSTSIENSYYLNAATKTNSTATQKNEEEFSNGTVLALLQAASDGSSVWVQSTDEKGYPTLNYTIEKATITADDFTMTNTVVTYGDSGAGVTVTAKEHIVGMGEITVKYYDANGELVIPVNVGAYTVKIDVAEGTNYNAATDVELGAFTISPKSLSDGDVSLSFETATYNGSEQKPEVTIDGLEENVDFTVVYGDSINAGTVSVTVAGIGNYTGTVEKSFTIEKATPNVSLTAPIDKVMGGSSIELNPTSDASEVNRFEIVEGEGYSVNGNVITIDDGVVVGTTLTVKYRSVATENYESVEGEITLTVGVPTVDTSALENAIDALEGRIEEIEAEFGTAGEVTKLREELDALKEAVSKLDNGYATDAELAETIGNVNNTITSLTTRVKNLEDTYATKTEVNTLRQDLNDQYGKLLELINANTLDIGTINTTLGEINTTLATLATKTDVESEISRLGNLITALTTRVSTTETGVSTNAGEISSLKTTVEALATELRGADDTFTDSVNGLSDALTTLTGRVDTAEQEIDALQQELASKYAELSNLINANTLDISAINTTLGEINTTLTTLATKTDVATEVATLTGLINALTERVTNTETGVSTNAGEISSLKTTVEDLATELRGADETLTNSVSGLSLALTTLTGRVDTAEQEIDKLQQDLADAIKDLDAAMKKGDADLSAEIATLNTALINAKAALEKADADNKAELVKKIEDADKALDEAIKAVQKNLDDAKAELDKAIADGDTALDTKISNLNTALTNAVAALEQADTDNKAELVKKIEEADASLQAAIDKVASDLAKAQKDLADAIATGDAALSSSIASVSASLSAAKTVLEKADADNKAALEAKIEAAEATLDAAIKAVQKNLDDAKAELNKAIADGDTELDGKISALGEALATAKAALETTDSANKSELTTKIDEADAALQTAINALSNELNATNEKVAALETFVIIVCVISGVAFCGCGTLAVFYIIDKKKKI